MAKDHKDHIQQILLPGYNYYELYDISLLTSQAFKILSHWYMSLLLMVYLHINKVNSKISSNWN